MITLTRQRGSMGGSRGSQLPTATAHGTNPRVFASPRAVSNFQRAMGGAVSAPLELRKGHRRAPCSRVGLVYSAFQCGRTFATVPDVLKSGSKPPHSKGALVIALHQTLRGRIKRVAPVEADCVASPVACGTPGFFARDRCGESIPGQRRMCPRPVCPLPLVDKRRRRRQVLQR